VDGSNATSLKARNPRPYQSPSKQNSVVISTLEFSLLLTARSRQNGGKNYEAHIVTEERFIILNTTNITSVSE
jgi:hypothetical protein